MGRKEEVEVLQKWLSDRNIKAIGIQGLGGIGKSSLAAYLYQNSGFAAKYWADVSQKPDFAAFAEKTIPALGGSVTQTGDTTELINDLVKCLRQQRCLLVIDNLETLLNEAREFPDSGYLQLFSRWLPGETSTLLVTTQEQPQELEESNGWYWYPLEGMLPTDGAELLQKQKIQGTVEELAAFAASMDGHPLTLELVAGYLRAGDNYQLSGVEELKLQQFDLVYRRAKGLHKNRTQKYVRLEWILQQHLQRLSEEHKDFLVNLSVYCQPFDFRAAESMLTSPPTPLLAGEGSNSEVFSAKDEGQVVDNNPTKEALGELYNRSLLLKTENKRYKFQPLVQEYLQKQGTDLSAAHEIAIDHYKSQVKPQPWETLEDVRAYLEIFYHLCKLQRYGEAFYTIRDDSCSNDVDNFLYLRGYNYFIVEVYEQLIKDWQPDNEEKQKILASFTSLGNAYHSMGQIQQAIHFHEKSLNAAREINHRQSEGASLGNLGNAYLSLGQYQEAICFHEQSLRIAREIGNRQDEAASLNNLGQVHRQLRQEQQAIDLYLQALKIVKEIGDKLGEAICLANLGGVYNSCEKYNEGIELLKQSLKIAREIGSRQTEAISLNNLGNAYYSLKEYLQSIKIYKQSIKIDKEIGYRQGEVDSLRNLGLAYSFMGQYQQAIGFYLQYLEIARSIGDNKVENDTFGNLGNGYYSLEKYQEAIHFYQQWLELAKKIGDKRSEGSSLGGLGNAYYYLGQYQKAIRFHLQCLEISKEIGDKKGEANSRQNLSISYYKIGRFREGFTAGYQANQILQQLRLPLEAMPYPNWMKLIAKFAQRGKWQLALCFILGLFAFPFALVLFVALMLWRVVRAQFRRRG